jgi:hypothetical protein
VAERLDLDAVADPGRPDAFLSGQCLLVRRDVYDAVGGFAAVAGSLVEDVALARRLKAAGHRLDVRLAPDLAAVRMYGRFGDLWEGLAKNLAEVWGADAGSLVRQATRALAGPPGPARRPGGWPLPAACSSWPSGPGAGWSPGPTRASPPPTRWPTWFCWPSTPTRSAAAAPAPRSAGRVAPTGLVARPDRNDPGTMPGDAGRGRGTDRSRLEGG